MVPDQCLQVAVDGKHLVGQPTGVGRALAGVLQGLDEIAPHDVSLRVLYPPPGARTLPWTMLGLPWRARGTDVLHCPFYYRPLLCACPTTVAVHDVLVLTHPHWFPWHGRRPFADLVRHAIRRSEAVITPSRCVLEEIETRMGSLGGRGVTIPLGVDSARFRPRDLHDVRTLCSRLGLDRPYLLHVGSLNPRRGLETGLAALALLDTDLELVIAGKAEHSWSGVPEELEPRVRRLGYVADDDLPLLMSGAEVVLALSRGEGFDLPLLEALACGAPVVASDIPPHREHFANLVELVPVGDVEAVAAAVGRLRESSAGSERSERSEVAHRRFRWRDTAAAYVEVWREVGVRR